MDSSLFGLIELTIVFGLVLGWSVRELWLLKRDKHDERDQRDKVVSGNGSDDANPELLGNSPNKQSGA